jgi:hypothetical protein
MGALFLLSDGWQAAAPSTGAAYERAASGSWGRVAAGYGLLAANLELSALLYSNNYDYSTILVALAATWAGSWWLLDGTKQGAALSVVCSLGAPAAELVLMSVFHTWHYSRPDILGGLFVSFVPCCYGGYVPLLGAFTRYLAASQRQ